MLQSNAVSTKVCCGDEVDVHCDRLKVGFPTQYDLRVLVMMFPSGRKGQSSKEGGTVGNHCEQSCCRLGNRSDEHRCQHRTGSAVPLSVFPPFSFHTNVHGCNSRLVAPVQLVSKGREAPQDIFSLARCSRDVFRVSGHSRISRLA